MPEDHFYRCQEEKIDLSFVRELARALRTRRRSIDFVLFFEDLHQDARDLPTAGDEDPIPSNRASEGWDGPAAPTGSAAPTHYVVDGGKACVVLCVLVTPGEVIENRRVSSRGRVRHPRLFGPARGRRAGKP